MSSNKSSRCYYLDLAKVIATFLVILGHMYSAGSPVRLYLYGFHMPFFFLVSGVFHQYMGKINWSQYAIRLLWPALIFIVLSITIDVVFRGERLSDQLRCYFIDIPMGNIRVVFWFFFALFWCKVYLDFFCGFKNKVIPLILWGILLFVPVILLKTRLPFGLSHGMMAFPFYAIGYWGRGTLSRQTASFKWGIPFICSLLLTMTITKYIHGRVSMMDVSFGRLPETLFGGSFKSLSTAFRAFLRIANIALFYLNGLIGSSMILSFSLLPFPRVRFVSSLSKTLITVVGLQYIFIHFITDWIGENHHIFVSIGLSSLVFLLCFLVHHILQPVFDLAQPGRLGADLK